eukprot:SAG31_NODE_651_length_13184_cov_4.999541_1_plen_79_part_10
MAAAGGGGGREGEGEERGRQKMVLDLHLLCVQCALPVLRRVPRSRAPRRAAPPGVIYDINIYRRIARDARCARRRRPAG